MGKSGDARAVTCGLALVAGCSAAAPASRPPAGSPEAAPEAGANADAAVEGGAVRDTSPEASALLLARPYVMNLNVPAAYDPKRPTPLVVMLHGYSTDGHDEETSYFKLTATSESKGFLYVYPDGTTDSMGFRFWNATTDCCNFYNSRVDDVAYLNALIDDIESRYNVDPKRVFIVGHSNGGFMAHRMGCSSAGRVAAVLSYAGAQTKNASRCQPTEPVSAVEMHGDQDMGLASVPYDGGPNGYGTTFPSAPATVALWAAKDRCTGTLDLTGQAFHVVPSLAGSETEVARYGQCPSGIDVELWTVHGGGHMDSLDTSAFGDAMWAFFSAHPKR